MFKFHLKHYICNERRHHAFVCVFRIFEFSRRNGTLRPPSGQPRPARPPFPLFPVLLLLLPPYSVGIRHCRREVAL